MADDDDDEDHDGERDPDNPSRKRDGEPWGIAYRSQRTKDLNINVTAEESWLWRTRPGVAYFHMNGTAVEALKALYRRSEEFLNSREAQEAKRVVMGRTGRNIQVNTKYTEAEREFWRLLAKRHGMSQAALLFWAFALVDLERGQDAA